MTRPGALLAGLLAAGLVGHLLGGCGGTTTDAGNPEIEFDFTNGGQPFSFQGSIQVYSASALPGFYVPEPEDDSPPSDDRPVLSASSKGNVFIPLKPVTRFSLDSTRLAGASSFRVLFPRLPPSAADSEFQIVAESDPDGHDTIRTFNLYFRGRGNMSAFVR